MEIEQKIKTYIAWNLIFSGDEFKYPEDASFLEEGIVDSLGVMELVSFVEDQFGVGVDDQDITPENFDSVTRLAAYIRRKQNGNH